MCPLSKMKSSSITICLAPFPMVANILLSVLMSFSFISHIGVKSHGSLLFLLFYLHDTLKAHPYCTWQYVLFPNDWGFLFLPNLSYTCYHLLVDNSHMTCLLIIATLTGVRWCLIAVSLRASEVEHLFMYLLTICMSS